jgi:hypothetical protein
MEIEDIHTLGPRILFAAAVEVACAVLAGIGVNGLAVVSEVIAHQQVAVTGSVE